MRFKPNSPRSTPLRPLAAIALALLAPLALHAQFNLFKKHKKPTPMQSSLDDYLKTVRARAIAKEDSRTAGSLWFPAAPMTETASDYKARHTGDLLIIRVVDNFSATANGTGSQQRAFSASSGISAAMGNLATTNRAQNLFSPTSAETLSGKGASTLSSTLSLNFAGHVVEALPNGVLVVEAVRDLTVGNDRQTIVLRGLVRPGDIASDGSVLSSQVSNLQAEINGKGLVADSIRQPNVVIRTLLKILNF
jgi:flagellar L-ring protein precursor FlgH